jgi:hypothetical protein
MEEKKIREKIFETNLIVRKNLACTLLMKEQHWCQPGQKGWEVCGIFFYNKQSCNSHTHCLELASDAVSYSVTERQEERLISATVKQRKTGVGECYLETRGQCHLAPGVKTYNEITCDYVWDKLYPPFL